MLIGLTGNIAVGKSTVAEFLKQKGATIINADKLGHQVLRQPEIKKELVLIFGKDILSNNEIAREKLAKLVFSDKKKLMMLNKIVHPQLLKLIDSEIEKHRVRPVRRNTMEGGPVLHSPDISGLLRKVSKGSAFGMKRPTNRRKEIIVIDAALIIEWNLQNRLDYLVVITSSPEKQIQRLVQYKSLSIQEAKERISAQAHSQEKIKQANFVINNDGSKEELRKQVDKLYAKLCFNLEPI